MLWKIVIVKNSKDEIVHEKILKEKFHDFREEENWPESCSLENNWGLTWLLALCMLHGHLQKSDGLNKQGLTVIAPHFCTVDSLRWKTPFLCFWRNVEKPETERSCAYSFAHSSPSAWNVFLPGTTKESQLALPDSLQMSPPLWSLPCHLQAKGTSIKGMTIGRICGGVCLSTGWGVLQDRFSNPHVMPHDPVRCEASQVIVIMCQLMNQAVHFLEI